MNINSELSDFNNKFDLFYAIVKNWKPILLISLAFTLLGLIYVFTVPKTFTSSTSFSISINKSIETAYGEYQVKTQNPSHYLSIFESDKFKDGLSASCSESTIERCDFKIIQERIDLPPNREHLIFPSKFELRVIGTKKTKLSEISDTAISMFLSNADKKLQEDMCIFFTSTLKKDLEKLKLSIQAKNGFIGSFSGDSSKIKELNAERLRNKDTLKIKLLEESIHDQTLLISSMLLNEGKGAKNYLDAVLTIEKVELKKLQNEVKNKLLLINNINQNKDSLVTVFGRPFSGSFLTLSHSELKADDWFSKSLKKVLIFFFAGFFIGTVVVSFRVYYK